MPIIIDPSKTHDFIPHSQIDEPNPATIVVRTPTVRDIHRVFQSEEDGLSQMWAILELCVVGWKNFNDPDGNPLEFSFDLYEHSPNDFITDCYGYVMERAKVTATEAGK